MGLLADVTTGRQVGAQIHTIFGHNGVGKTTWAAAFPSCLLADLENGSWHIEGISRITADKLPNLSSFRALLKELKEGSHTYKTFVIDSAESLEGIISDAVCTEGKCDSIEKYEGGYGKGYARSRELMREIMIELQALQKKGITSIIVAHSQVKAHTDPVANQTYDRVIMRCNDKFAAIIRDLSDNVFYATYKVFTNKDGGKTKAYGDGQRIMYTQWRPGYDAKNRLELPLEVPLSYDAFVEACSAKPEGNSENLLSDIREMSEKVDAKLKTTVEEQVEKYKNDAKKLREIKNRLMKYVS